MNTQKAMLLMKSTSFAFLTAFLSENKNKIYGWLSSTWNGAMNIVIILYFHWILKHQPLQLYFLFSGIHFYCYILIIALTVIFICAIQPFQMRNFFALVKHTVYIFIFSFSQCVLSINEKLKCSNDAKWKKDLHTTWYCIVLMKNRSQFLLHNHTYIISRNEPRHFRTWC